MDIRNIKRSGIVSCQWTIDNHKARSVIQFHPSVDGNKRTAVAITVIFLLEQGYRIRYTQEETVGFSVDIAGSRVTLETIEKWLGARVVTR